jgi:transposase-like protein
LGTHNTKKSTGIQGRLPAAYDGLQINFCRNLECPNFGILPLPKVSRGRNPKITDNYRSSGDTHFHSDPCLICKQCNEAFTLKSNRGMVEEFERQKTRFNTLHQVHCRNTGCQNHLCTDATQYQSFGKSHHGSHRYRCKACGKTFSVGITSTSRQRKPEINELVFRLLVNKMPMRRICEAASVEPAVLYNRVKFIHRQTERFSVDRERRLSEGMHFKQLRIAVDRQDHVFNWVSSADRRNTKLSAVASADCSTGYVFGMYLDYDPGYNPYEIDLHAREIGDYDLRVAYRRYARFFLPGDTGTPAWDSFGLEPGSKLPAMGLRVHSEYVLMGHFLFLRWLLPNVDRFQFYLDREQGIRAACIGAFKERVKNRSMDAFYVRIGKDMTVEEKKLEVARSEALLAKLQAAQPTLSKRAVALQVMTDRYIAAQKQFTHATDRWVESVLPHMGEPQKHVCYLTDRGDAEPAAVAEDMLFASLHPVDRFFMQIRRRISLLERPIATASAAHRMWYGYGSYNPEIAQRIMDIFRTVYNYNLVGKDGKTPAMRIGLATEPVSFSRLLEYI